MLELDHSTLPDISSATLPGTYDAARIALLKKAQ